ncbi:unnamed protein product [Nezara viridula]|uniref:SET domain-containing protein n=1 Tax=Nezara viridula TaxID=85310 RepID=A0A9P0HQC3_NEZVI|nr:unnamed protein product [Nezara viridula]
MATVHPTYIIKNSSENKLGRYVVAGRDLRAGEEIFQEEIFSIGPKSGSPLICLGCYLPLEELKLCNTCKWPICSPECSQEPWHKNYECEVFSQKGVKLNEEADISAQLECITPLRTLIVSEKQNEQWEKEVSNMEAHTEERRKKIEWAAEQVNVVNFLVEACKLKDRFNEDKIQKICGILEVNCFEVITKLGISIRGLYPRMALLNHNCIANTTHSVFLDKNYRLQLRTTVDTKSGCELFSSYTSSLQPTIVRRARLRECKYFDCTCARCSDPTEMGTHIGTFKCTKCDNGFITSTQPLDDNAPWKCSHCDNGITGNGVQRIYLAIQEDMAELEQMEMDGEKLEATEKLLRKYKSVLHPRNGSNVLLWHSLSQMYGHTEGYSLDMLPDLLLERKSKFCKDLLDILNIVEPGLTRIRGLTLFEYHIGCLLYTKSRYQHGEFNKDALKERIHSVVDILKECHQILSLEPEGTPEAMLAASALQSINQLIESVEQL